MNILPTAEEWLQHYEEIAYPGTPMSECMIEFAKLHVEAQAKIIFEKSKNWKDLSNGYSYHPIKEESILNAYPLTLIK
jgi:hypothetical protein